MWYVCVPNAVLSSGGITQVATPVNKPTESTCSVDTLPEQDGYVACPWADILEVCPVGVHTAQHVAAHRLSTNEEGKMAVFSVVASRRLVF
jgi:hypothetical protein